MSERKLFNAKEPVEDHLRKKWVELDTGWVSVWELEFSDMMFIKDQSVRLGPGGAETPSPDAVMWQILVSCHLGDQAGSPRAFEITDLPRIQKLRSGEYQKILLAMQEVNSLNEQEVNALKDFTPARPGGKARK